MSRIGNKPIALPQGVEVKVADGEVTVKGPKGTLSQAVHPDMQVQVENRTVRVVRPTDQKQHRALHGLTRALISNMVTGVTAGYQRTLELMGVGYRVQQQGKNIVLTVGLTHPVEITPSPGVELQVEGNNRIHVRGSDKQKVGETAAIIRRVRPPNPYKEKGIKYMGEQLKLKPGKAAARKK